MDGNDMGVAPVNSAGFEDGAYDVYDYFNFSTYTAWEKKVVKAVSKIEDTADFGDKFSFDFRGHAFDFEVSNLDNCGCEKISD